MVLRHSLLRRHRAEHRRLPLLLASHDLDRSHDQSHVDPEPGLFRSLLVHLHGRAHIYDSLVYTEEHYRELARHETYKHLLRDVFINHPVLALGFGWTDPPFIETLRFIKEEMSSAGKHTHYAILP